MLSKREKGVSAIIYTNTISKQLQHDIKLHNTQYEHIEIEIFTKSHDRFLIIDHATVYHIGASLKDLGKKPVVSLSNDGLPFQKSLSMQWK